MGRANMQGNMQGNIPTIKMHLNETGCQSGVALQGMVSYAGCAEQGARSQQQDRIYIGERPPYLLAVVCDGMGGLEDGGKASSLAVEIIEQRFLTSFQMNERRFLYESVQKIDREICRMTNKGKRIQSGTTIAAALLSHAGLYWLSVGDSRLYLYRVGKLLCPVQDHNYRLILKERLERREIAYEQYLQEEKHPNAEGLISYLGIGGVPRIEINARPFTTIPGDKVLLCSDGLYKRVSEEEMKTVLETETGTSEKVNVLLQTALERGGAVQDNTSAILLEIF